MKPRDWQSDVLKQFVEHDQQSFVIEAPTGAGKTDTALLLRGWWVERQHGVPLTIITAPNVGVLRKWLAEVAHLGRTAVSSLDVDDRVVSTVAGERKLERVDFAPPADLMFWGMTDQALEARKGAVRRIAAERPTIAIADELHRLDSSEHTAWGPACEYAFASADRIIGLSATPFRTRGRVSFLNENADGFVEPDYQLSRREAVDKEYICPLRISFWDADMTWQRRSRADGRTVVFKSAISDPRRADEALSRGVKDPDVQNEMIAEGIRALDHVRRLYSLGMAMIVCDRQELAKQLVGRVQRQGRTAVAVISDNANSHVVMDALRDGKRNEDFMVTVGMAREGCDIPRLKVIIWLSAVKTLVGFIQTTGRVVRWVDAPGLEAVCVLPDHPVLAEYAEELLELQVPAERESAPPGDGDDRERMWDDDGQSSENQRPTATIDGLGEKHEIGSQAFAMAKKHGIPIEVAEAIVAERERSVDGDDEELTNGNGETPPREDPGLIREQVARLIGRVARACGPIPGPTINMIKRAAVGRADPLQSYSLEELVQLRAMFNRRVEREGW